MVSVRLSQPIHFYPADWSGTEGLTFASANQQEMSRVMVSAFIRNLQPSLSGSIPGSRPEI